MLGHKRKNIFVFKNYILLKEFESFRRFVLICKNIDVKVPQYSVLEPLLFFIRINDLHINISS